jgi:hypothetical protein
MVNFKLARGPNSLMGVAATPEEQAGTYVNKKTQATKAGAVSMRIVPLEKLVAASSGASSSLPPLPRGGGVALLHPDNPLLAEAATSGGGIALLTLEAGSDFVLRCAAWPGVPPGTAALLESDRYNIHVAEDQTASFKLFTPPAAAGPVELVDVQLEVRLLRVGVDVSGAGGGSGSGAGAGKEAEADGDEDEDEDDENDDDDDEDDEAAEEVEVVEVDGAVLAAASSRRLAGRWVCAGELMMLDDGDDGFGFLRGLSLRTRVVSANTLDPEVGRCKLKYVDP